MATPAEKLPNVRPDTDELTFDPEQPLRVIGYTEIDGVEAEVYDTNNLEALYAAFLRVEGIEEGTGPGFYDDAVEQNWGGARDILTRHAVQNPGRMRQIADYNRRQRIAYEREWQGMTMPEDMPVLKPTPQRRFEVKALFSETYKELEPIAWELAPGLNPRELCR